MGLNTFRRLFAYEHLGLVPSSDVVHVVVFNRYYCEYGLTSDR